MRSSITTTNPPDPAAAPAEGPASSPPLGAIVRGLIHVAAFFFSAGFFITTVKYLRFLPDTAPVAAGRVISEHASKLQDYVAGMVLMVGVPLLAVWLDRVGLRLFEWLIRPLRGTRLADRDDLIALTAVVFTLPFFFSPFLYIVTKKELWSVPLPIALCFVGPLLIRLTHTRFWFRQILAAENGYLHALLIAEGGSWVLFRYLAAGRRIAHMDSLLLEAILMVSFVALFWGTAVFLARWTAMIRGGSAVEALRGLAFGGIPLLVLAPLGLTHLSGGVVMLVVLVSALIGGAWLTWRRQNISPRTVRLVLVLLVVPMILFVLDYGSSAWLSKWVDLFHRGESLGPASDYLRGKAPYVDVFPLHGMLEDGLLDAWLMQIFGRSVTVAVARSAILSSLMLPGLWLLGFALFESMPLALLVAGLGLVMSADNQRAVLEIACVTLLLAAIRMRRTWPVAVAGVAAAVAVFFSLDTGLYSLVAGSLTIVVIARVAPRDERPPLGRWLAWWAGGIALGAAPFIIYLAIRGAVGAFITTSFVSVPGIIDAVWSLPFPDLIAQFRQDLGTMSLFDVAYRFRFILNPLVIGIASMVLLVRFRRRNLRRFDQGLVVLVLFAIVSQRSALGRADLPHQWFSAFLISPIVVALLVSLSRMSRSLRGSSQPGGRVVRLGLGLLLIAAGLPLLWVPGLLEERLSQVIDYRARTSVAGFEDPKGSESAQRISQVHYWIDWMVPKGEPIFDFSNQAAFYFFADRPNPTRFYQVPIMSPRAFQLEVVRGLQKARPAVVLMTSPDHYDEFDGIPNDLRAPVVAGWIRTHYRLFRIVRGVELWRWNGAPHEGWKSTDYEIPPQRIGAQDEPERTLLFPAAGSLHGAKHSVWRSELWIQNPHDRDISVDFRYRSGELTRDRTISLRPGQLIHEPDVVADFFVAPSTQGAIWIHARADQVPVARLLTRDVNHPGTEAFQSPYTRSDAATAGEELLVLGVSSGKNRRVNLGLVNFGQKNAQVTIELRDPVGRTVGQPIEQLIEEGSSWVLVDAARQIGAQIDTSMSLHVVVSEGSVVGYASVVDTAVSRQEILPAVVVPGERGGAGRG